ncbi:MAG TPA: 3-isopropylmalate dehydratase small subunit [Gemmatimonadaceae bacterium]
MTGTQWKFSSTYVVLPTENVDTDQIIPARFLTTTSRAGLGPNAFNDWRYLADGSPDPNFVLNKPESKGAEVLVAGHNFGCGSSREHAVWALAGAGFRAVVSSTFADGLSHFGPPTAPSSTASARLQIAVVSSGSAVPVASIAAPPINASEKVNFTIASSAAASSTRRACSTISGPIPSPGSSAMWYSLFRTMVMLHPPRAC